MDLPDYQSLMRPVLELAEGGEHSIGNAVERIAADLELSEEQLAVMLPSGRQTTFANRVHWAKTYLKKAGLIAYPKRGYFEITERGKAFLQSHPGAISNADLKVFESFVAFQNLSHSDDDSETPPSLPILDTTQATPEEAIENAYGAINNELAAELIERVQNMPPVFFEKLLVQLLIAMGYGGSAEEAGRDLGKSGDGGVDGVIDQDPLGVDQIYIQAKRYADGNNVGSGAVRDFFGALNIKRASKGIFFTTSSFSKGAKDTASALGSRIVLIDGAQLARLMIRYQIGCRAHTTLILKKLDEDFFEDV